MSDETLPDPDPSASTPSGRRWYTRKRLLVPLSVVVLLLLVALWLGRPVQPDLLQPDAESQDLASVLYQDGYEAVVADVDASRALVRFELPDGIAWDDAFLHVGGRAAVLAPDSEWIVLQAYRDGVALEQTETRGEDFRAYLQGDLSRDDLEARTVRTPG